MTASEWFEELAERPAERVWEAVRRCRREQSFRPTLAELLDAMTLAARERAARRLALPAPDRLGVPPPPVVKAQLDRILSRRPPPLESPPPGPALSATRDDVDPADFEAERRRQLAALKASESETP